MITTQNAPEKFGVFSVFSVFWANRTLIFRLLRRDIEGRYRGSLLGGVWLVLTPLFMLSVYSFIFSVVFQARWSTIHDHQATYTLLLYAGLILYSVFSEPINRAPTVLLENVSYIKKVVFPLEILPIVVMGTTLFGAGISLLILLVFQTLTLGMPPTTWLLLPLVLAPLVLVSLGISWFLASLGVFLRDIRHVVGVVTSALMFLSPIFYPITAVPEGIRPLVYANPLTIFLEQAREILFLGSIPHPGVWLGTLVAAWSVASCGLWWFMRTRKGFADVV